MGIGIGTFGGFIWGVVFGLVPLVLGLRWRIIGWGIGSLLLTALVGFALGLFGALPIAFVMTGVVVSFAYVDREDPFTSRKGLDEVDFEEGNADFALRQMAGIGRATRISFRALVRNVAGFIGFLGIVFFISMTAFGPLLIEYEGEARIDRRQENARTLFQGPSAEFPLGLDWQGRDVLSHVVYGGRNLIVTSLQAGLFTTVLAVILGATAGLLGGLTDQILSAIANFFLTVPQFPLLLVLASILELNNTLYLAILFGVLGWPALMRAVRAQVLSLRERDYVQAAISLDLGLGHIIFREVLPNMISYIVVNMIFSIRAAMYSIVGLVFLGMVPLEEPDWGVMIFMGRQQGAIFNQEAFWMLLSPIMAIALFQLSLVLFTRSLEEIFNPRLRQGL